MGELIATYCAGLLGLAGGLAVGAVAMQTLGLPAPLQAGAIVVGGVGGAWLAIRLVRRRRTTEVSEKQVINARGHVTVRLDQIFGLAPKQPPAQQDNPKETTNGTDA